MPELLERLAYLVIGATAGLAGAWINARRTARYEKTTRWIQRRREVYSSFIHGAREIYHAMERHLRKESTPEEVTDAVAARWAEMEERYSDFLLIASNSTFQAAADVRTWSEEAGKLLSHGKSAQAKVEAHMSGFWDPASRFLDACRIDIDSPPVRTVWHENADRERERGRRPNPYGGD